MMEKERVVFLDYVRVVSSFLVMLVHASENFYGADFTGMAASVSMLATESNRFWVAFYDGGIARTCVPLFMVVSSFLLVPMRPGQDMKSFYCHRFLRILPPMICFMFIYSLLPLAWGGMTWEQSMQDLRMIPLNFPSMAGHLWSMYPLISLYLIIPVVSPWLERASAKDELLFLGFFLLSTVIPWFQRLGIPEIWGACFWNRYDMLWYCSGYLGFLVMAHYIRVHLVWPRSKRFQIGLVCFLIGSTFTAWSFWWQGVPGKIIETRVIEWAWEFCTPNVVLATFGAFLLFTCIEKKQAPKLITAIAKQSYGMYLMHMLFLAPISNAIIAGDPAHPHLPVWLAIPVVAASTFICSAITTKLVSFIPGSKWIIG